MKSIGLALGGAALLVPALAACGSSAAQPSFATSCSTHKLANGRIEAHLKVTNLTGRARNAVIYGPALAYVGHVKPVLRPVQVASGGHDKAAGKIYVGFIVPKVKPQKVAHVTLRLRHPPQPMSILAATGSKVSGSTRNDACVVR